MLKAKTEGRQPTTERRWKKQDVEGAIKKQNKWWGLTLPLLPCHPYCPRRCSRTVQIWHFGTQVVSEHGGDGLGLVLGILEFFSLTIAQFCDALWISTEPLSSTLTLNSVSELNQPLHLKKGISCSQPLIPCPHQPTAFPHHSHGLPCPTYWPFFAALQWSPLFLLYFTTCNHNTDTEGTCCMQSTLNAWFPEHSALV